MTAFDLIIVGGGTAGCFLASQLLRQTGISRQIGLSRQAGLRIAIVEPGPRSDLPASQAIDRTRPARWLRLLGSADDWGFATEPNVGLAGRSIGWPRGRGLGGSSRINAMIWFPLTPRDIAEWSAATGGRIDQVAVSAAMTSVTSIVQPESPRWISDASQAFLSATKTWPRATPMAHSRINRNGTRWDLASLVDADRVTIVRGEVDRVLFRGDAATGVRVVHQGSVMDLHADKGVVLSGGTIASPMILMRSGIGDADQLRGHGIDVRVDRPRVGRGLRDHLVMPVIYQTKSHHRFKIDPDARDVVQHQTLGTGPLSSNVAEVGGLFDDSRFQIHVTPTHYLTFPKPSPSPMMTIAVNATKPESTGQIRLRSSSVGEGPIIDANYLGEAEDRQRLVEGVKLVRKIASESSLANFIDYEALPGPKRIDDASIEKAIERYSQTLYHPVGTCAIGLSDNAPVDPDFGVCGTERLWVCDASLLPTMTTANPSAAVMMGAVLAAERIASRL